MKPPADDEASDFEVPKKGNDWYDHQTGFIKHHCTDMICCIFFLVALCGFIAVSVVAYMHGDLRKLYHGLDWESNLCGVDAETLDYSYVYWCRDAEHTLDTARRVLAVPHQREAGADAFAEGERVEGKDSSGRWWPLIITQRFPNGSYAGEVEDGFGTVWPSIHEKNLRKAKTKPVPKYKVGEHVHGKDTSGKFWPVTITKVYANGSYAGEVDDGFRTQWPLILPSSLQGGGVDYVAIGESGQSSAASSATSASSSSASASASDNHNASQPKRTSDLSKGLHQDVVNPSSAKEPKAAGTSAAGPQNVPLTPRAEVKGKSTEQQGAPQAQTFGGGGAVSGNTVVGETDIDTVVVVTPPPIIDEDEKPSKTTVTTTKLPYKVAMGPADAMRCPLGFQRITSAMRCQQVAHAYDYDFQGVGDWCVTPSGCSKWHDDKRVWFSTCPEGESTNYTLICEQAHARKCKLSEVLNPGEDMRSYSSRWANDKNGKGHASSQLDSPKEKTFDLGTSSSTRTDLQAQNAGDDTGAAVGEWMTMNLANINHVIGVVVQGRQSVTSKWVTDFIVSSSADGTSWDSLPEPFVADSADIAHRGGKEDVSFPYAIEAQYVQIKIVDRTGVGPALRAGVRICKEWAPPPTPAPPPAMRARKAPKVASTGTAVSTASTAVGGMCDFDGPYGRTRIPCGKYRKAYVDQEDKNVDLRYPVCVKACPENASARMICRGPEDYFWDEAAYETHPILGHYCIPRNHSTFVQMMSSLCDHAVHNFMHKSALAFLETWPLMIVTTLSAILVGYLYLFFLRSFAVPVITCTVTTLCIFFGGSGLGLLITGLFFGGVDGIKNTCDKWNDVAVGCICLSICIAYMVCACKGKTLMRKSANTMKVSFEAFFQCPALAIEPMFATIIRICWLACWTSGFLLIISMGEIQKEEVYRSFTLTWKEKLMLAYYILMYIWISEFLTSLRCFVMTFILQRWFYQRGWNDEFRHAKPSLPCSVICTAYQTSIYHLGSLAMGSFLIPLAWPIKLLWRLCIWVSSCGGVSSRAQTCTARYWSSIGFINKEGYSDVALFSVNYMPGTVHANRQVLEKRAEVGPLIGACLVVELVGLGLMVLIGGVLMFFEMKGLTPLFQHTLQFFAEDPVLPASIAAILAAFFGTPMLLAFGEVADDLLYCYSMEDDVKRLYREEDVHEARGLLDCSGLHRKEMKSDNKMGTSPAWLQKWIIDTSSNDHHPAE